MYTMFRASFLAVVYESGTTSVPALPREWRPHSFMASAPWSRLRPPWTAPPSQASEHAQPAFAPPGLTRPGEDEFDIGFPIDNGTVWSAAEWFARIAWVAFLEMQDTRSRPRGLRMLDA